MKDVDFKQIQKLLHKPDVPKEIKNLLYTFGELNPNSLQGFGFKLKCHIRDAVHPTLTWEQLKEMFEAANTVSDDPVFHLDFWAELYKEYEVFASNIPDTYQFNEKAELLLPFLKEYVRKNDLSDVLLWLAQNQPGYLVIQNQSDEEV